MQARMKIITCFVAPAILKIMKIGDLKLMPVRYTIIPINTIYIN
jgi:hypothetical protein